MVLIQCVESTSHAETLHSTRDPLLLKFDKVVAFWAVVHAIVDKTIEPFDTARTRKTRANECGSHAPTRPYTPELHNSTIRSTDDENKRHSPRRLRWSPRTSDVLHNGLKEFVLVRSHILD